MKVWLMKFESDYAEPELEGVFASKEAAVEALKEKVGYDVVKNDPEVEVDLEAVTPQVLYDGFRFYVQEEQVKQ